MVPKKKKCTPIYCNCVCRLDFSRRPLSLGAEFLARRPSIRFRALCTTRGSYSRGSVLLARRRPRHRLDGTSTSRLIPCDKLCALRSRDGTVRLLFVRRVHNVRET